MPPARRLTPALVAAALCLSTFAPLPRLSVAAACPVELPSPLRVLYLSSERVVVARAGEPVPVEGAEVQVARKTPFEVTESLKGDGGEKQLYVYHYNWNDSADGPTNFRRGDTRLLFLRRGEDEKQDGYYVTDARYGAKKLSEADLKVYLKRIEELQWVMRTGKPDPDELLEWLVRCAEEPATRWEGAYELAMSAAAVAQEEAGRRGESGVEEVSDETEASDEEDKALDAELGIESEDDSADAGETEADDSADEVSDEAEAEAEAGVEAESAGEADGEAGESAAVETTDESEGLSSIEVYQRGFVSLYLGASVIKRLNAEQKERLASALYGAETVGLGEIELVEVVAGFDDARLAPYLVKQLRKLVDDPSYEAERLAYALGVALKDKQVARLAQKYSENAPYYDPPEETEGEEAEDGVTAGQKPSDDAKPAKPTHTQRRSELLKKFIAAVEKRMNVGAETAEM